MAGTPSGSSVEWGVPSIVSRSLETAMTPVLGLNAPRKWVLQYRRSVGFDVRVTIEEVNGQPEIVELSLYQPEGQRKRPINAALLRSIPLRGLKRACLEDRLDEGAKSFLALADEPRGGGRARITREHLDRVAQAYRAAEQAGVPRLGEIMRRFDVQRSTAEKYIARAREAGLLEPARPRRTPETGKPNRRGTE